MWCIDVYSYSHHHYTVLSKNHSMGLSPFALETSSNAACIVSSNASNAFLNAYCVSAILRISNHLKLNNPSA